MSKAKYKTGIHVMSMAHFEACRNIKWYKWNGKTVHRSVLEHLQYETLYGVIKNGHLCIAKPIEEEDTNEE